MPDQIQIRYRNDSGLNFSMYNARLDTELAQAQSFVSTMANQNLIRHRADPSLNFSTYNARSKPDLTPNCLKLNRYVL